MSKKNTTDPVVEAEKKVTELTASIAEKVVARDALADELRSLRSALKAAKVAVTRERAVALIALADDPTRFAEEAEKLRLAAAKPVVDKAVSTADPAPEAGHHYTVESGCAVDGFGGDQ